MEKTRSSLYRFLTRRLGRAVVCGLFAALLLALIRAPWPVTFLNNDDTNIMRALSGDYSGVPTASHPFINVVLSVPCSVLYSIMPGVAWWPLVHLLALWAGITVLLAALFKAFTAKGLPLWLPAAIGAFFTFTLYGYAIVRMTFTLTSAILGTGALATVLAFGTEEKDLSSPLLPMGFALLLAIACFAFRNSAGMSMLPFWLLGCLYRLYVLFGHGLPLRKCAAALLLPLLLCVVAVGMDRVNTLGIEHFNGPAFMDYDDARSRYMDYAHDSYAKNPGLYASVGWDEDLARLAESRFFMDERITPEAFRAIYEGSSIRTSSLFATLWQGLKLGVRTVRGNGQILYCMIGMLLTLAIAAVGCARTKRLPVFLFCLCFAGGGFLLCYYLCCAGRFPLRTFFMIAYPTQIGMAFACLDLITPQCALSERLTRGQRFRNLGLTAAVFAGCLLSACLTVSALNADDVSKTLRASKKLISYVRIHPSNLYVRAPLTGYDIDPYTSYTGTDLSNLLEWGGTGMHTLYMRRQLARKDIADLSPEIFSWDRVYYVARNGDTVTTAAFEGYMVSRWGATGLRAVDTISDLYTIYEVTYPNDALPEAGAPAEGA